MVPRRIPGMMSEMFGRFKRPDKALEEKQAAERRGEIPLDPDDEGIDSEVEFEVDLEHEPVNESSEITKDAQDDEKEEEVGGVVGSRRTGRYVETPKYPDRKWKRDDKHRGDEKPHKQGRRPTGAEGREEDLAA